MAVERFSEWIVDSNTLLGEFPVLNGMGRSCVLMAYVERKLLTVNTGHAACAYLGHLYGHKTIYDAIHDERIRPLVQGAMEESGRTLLARYPKMNWDSHLKYIEQIICRFENPYICDEVTRVGRDPIRKLGSNDRLVKPLKDAAELGTPRGHLVVACAAALLYHNDEDAQSIQLETCIKEQGVTETFSKITGLKADHQIVDEVGKEYEALQSIITSS